ncbi:recombinase family protein [Halococcus sp. PRR34]|uniref:recombinase family protein n=1 Tax=Halococcus sp. PRR34 TaxID=3020830 RepID=UPI00235ED251|nr:recombinase family protein [Halococcus sp. PRR34]
MARYATCIRASTDTQETTHQRDAINGWLDDHDVGPDDVDRYADLGYSGSDPDREQFSELSDAIDTGEYEYVVVWEISWLARLGSIYQRFFERCEDAGTTVAITDGWISEVRPDGTGKLIADISTRPERFLLSAVTR